MLRKTKKMSGIKVLIAGCFLLWFSMSVFAGVQQETIPEKNPNSVITKDSADNGKSKPENTIINEDIPAETTESTPPEGVDTLNKTATLQTEYNLSDDSEEEAESEATLDDFDAGRAADRATIYESEPYLSDYPSNSGDLNITQVGRYSTAANHATKSQIDPLAAVAQFRFQPNVKTIEDAIHQVLQNTSYELVPEKQLSNLTKETLAKPLPITVRTLGPIKIKEALLVLMGQEVFNIQVDKAHRLINFKTKPSAVKAQGANNGRKQK